MDEQTAVALLTEKVREYAQARQQDVAGGGQRPPPAPIDLQN
jgi:hypothetical protein